MTLPRLRSDLTFMPSPVDDRPGLLIRDPLGYSDAVLIIPPFLVSFLLFFDGSRTVLDLHAELARIAGDAESENVAQLLADRLSEAGFLEDETYARLKQRRHTAFAQSEVRRPAHAGNSYPADIDPLREVMQRYLDGAPASYAPNGVIGIAAPHASPEHTWRSYQAAYQCLTPHLRDRTFVILGTSHYGQPDKFGLTRKPFETPYGRTQIDDQLVAELAAGQPAVVMEDYCHAVEHSIEFQVLFLQSIYGPDVRILPILCGPSMSIDQGGLPEHNDQVKRFLGTLGNIAARESSRLFWVLGIDMAHMGARYGDNFVAQADSDEMALVAERDARRIERVNASDPQGFWDLVQENKDDLKWCGSSPLYTFLKALPGTRGTLHRYEQWNIDDQSMVSLAGISFRA